MEKKPARIGLYVSPDFADLIAALARAQQRSMGEVVTELCCRALGRDAAPFAVPKRASGRPARDPGRQKPDAGTKRRKKP